MIDRSASSFFREQRRTAETMRGRGNRASVASRFFVVRQMEQDQESGGTVRTYVGSIKDGGIDRDRSRGGMRWDVGSQEGQ